MSTARSFPSLPIARAVVERRRRKDEERGEANCAWRQNNASFGLQMQQSENAPFALRRLHRTAPVCIFLLIDAYLHMEKIILLVKGKRCSAVY